MGTIAYILLGVLIVVALYFVFKKKPTPTPTPTPIPNPTEVYTWYATGVQESPCGGAMGQIYYSSYASFAWNSISFFYLDTALTNRFIPTVAGKIGYTNNVDSDATLFVANVDFGGMLTGHILCS